MILTYQERQALTTKLGDKLLNLNGGPFIYAMLGSHGARIASSPVYTAWAYNIIEYCEQSAWVEIPPLLNRLLSQFPLDPLVVPIENRIKTMKPPTFHRSGAQYDTCLVAMELPFLNRDISRRALADFPLPLKPSIPGGPRPARILLVNGQPGSGKSFTLNYLRYLVQVQAGSYNLVWADYDVHENVRTGQVALAQHIVEQIYPGWIIPTEGTDVNRPERLAQNLTQQLAAAAAKATRDKGKQRWYITLDNFHHPYVSEDIHLFIRQLSAGLAGEPLGWEMEDPNEGTPLRLLLLNYVHELAVPHGDLLRTELISPINADHLVAFFREYCLYKGWQPGMWPDIPHFLQDTANSVIAAAPVATDSNHAKLIGRAVMSLVAAFEAARPQKLQQGGEIQ
ncbi:MAG: hypothetical protein JWL77_3315 [Chthonomonadaceae bacterium]|nr:hypothetical protein [Chthonomonadaceae bacterium]